MAWLKRVCIAAALIVVASFGFLLHLDNATPVALRLLNRETAPQPVFWWLLYAFAFGLFVGFALCFSGYLRGRLAERRLRQTLREREHELAGAQGGQPGPEEATAGEPRKR